MRDDSRTGESTLSEMAARDRRLAEAAAHDAALELPVAAGRPDHPHPDIAAADRVRAEDDVDAFRRQEAVAEQQAEAAETMEDNQRRLFETAERIEAVRDEAHQRTDQLEALAADSEELRRQTRALAEQAGEIEPPPV
jgi:hypothetical protein